jgi:hypothetical protein
MINELTFYIIITVLNFFLFSKIGTNIFLLHSSDILLDQKMLLNSLVSHTIIMSLRHFQTSIGMSLDPNVLCVFIIFKISFI